MKRSEVDKSKLSPMMLQYLDIKEKYEDAILFYRVGDFYEMFFEDALTASRELEITLTGKSCGLEERVDMCGMPFHSYMPYLEKLVDKGYKVVVCEQLTPPDKKGIVERGITQIVTKGTMMEQNALDEKSNNYIASLYDFGHFFALTFADISTGAIYSRLFSSDKEKVINEIVRLDIKEVIVNDEIDRDIINTLREGYHILISIEKDIDSNEYRSLYSDIEDERIVTSVKHLLSYLSANKKDDLVHLKKVEIVKEGDTLLIDVHSKRNLELVETLRLKERTYSLLWLLDKTKTAMGSRALKNYIENPLIDRKQIERRYDYVSTFLNEFILKEELREALNSVYDLERLSGRISYGNVNARDLLQLKASLKMLPVIKKILKDINYDKSFNALEDLYDLLDKSINEDAPITIKEGNIIKSGFNSELDELKSLSSSASFTQLSILLFQS